MAYESFELRMMAIRIIVLVCSFVLHEWGHAIMADRLGDDTPRSQGRVTLNPLAHIDPIGSILLPVMCVMFGGILIGWAKPVYTNPANFRRGYFDQALVTIAGPGMNVILALAGTFGAVIMARTGVNAVEIMHQVILINVILIVFNLLPIPPLDGSKFLLYFRIMSEDAYMRFAQWGGLLLLGLILLPQTRGIFQTLIELGLVPFALIVEALT